MALNLFKKPAEPERMRLVAQNAAGGYSFEYDATDTVAYNEGMTTVYTSLDTGIPYYQVFPVLINDITIGTFIMQDKAETEAHFGKRLAYEPKILTETIGRRKIAGIQYVFTDEKNAKTYVGVHCMMPYDRDGSTMRWVAFCELTDTRTQDDMWKAIKTIKIDSEIEKRKAAAEEAAAKVESAEPKAEKSAAEPVAELEETVAEAEKPDAAATAIAAEEPVADTATEEAAAE